PVRGTLEGRAGAGPRVAALPSGPLLQLADIEPTPARAAEPAADGLPRRPRPDSPAEGSPRGHRPPPGGPHRLHPPRQIADRGQPRVPRADARPVAEWAAPARQPEPFGAEGAGAPDPEQWQRLHVPGAHPVELRRRR